MTTEGGLAWEAIAGAPHSLQILGGGGVTREIRLVGDDLTIGTANATGRYVLTLSDTSKITEEASFVGALAVGTQGFSRNRNHQVCAGTNRIASKIIRATNGR